MAFCSKCGRQIDDGGKFCPACGAPVSSETQSQYTGTGTPTQGYTQSNDTPPDYDPADIENNKGISVLCYFGLLLLIPFLTRKDSKYVKFHSNQGIVLLIVDVIFVAFTGVAKNMFWLPHIIRVCIDVVSSVGGIAILVLMIIGIVNAVGGKVQKLPVIGDIEIIK